MFLIPELYNGFLALIIMDYTIKIGGEAGQGIQTIGDTLAKVFSRSGYHVFTHQDYESRVRGGHNFFQIRFSDKPVSASKKTIDILIALDRESVARHTSEISPEGFIVYDSSMIKEVHEDSRFLDIPFEELAIRHGGSKIMANTVATGTILGMIGMGTEIFIEILKDALKKKPEDVVEANIKSAVAGYNVAIDRCVRCAFTMAQPSPPKMLVTTNEAIAIGALASGCKFYCAYPMTPSTGIMLYLAGKAKEYGVIVEQAEDEISAVNMAIGASFAGVRSMTGTSGGGFALMGEGVSLAGMTETPLVVAIAQRPGPATGLPTRTEQADLFLVLHAGHGEFPRIIFAPGNPGQGFHLANRAFELSQKYQIPVFILTDQYLADALWTQDSLDTESLLYNDYRVRGDAFAALPGYKRHVFTESGVSPFGIPGDSSHLVVTDSDEHDEEGHIIEDAETRIRMVEKRFHKKFPLVRREMEPPVVYGANEPEIVVVGWGSTYGIMKEAVDEISRRAEIAMLHFSEIYPLPLTERFDYMAVLKKAKRTVCVESNAGGQFAALIRTETGFEFDRKVNRYDGRPFLLEELIGEIDAIAR